MEGNENKHVCGRNAYMICRMDWGDTEDFANVGVDHKSKSQRVCILHSDLHWH